MRNLKSYAASILLAVVFIGLPLSVLFWSRLELRISDRTGTYIGVGIFLSGASAVGAVAAALICSARSPDPRYGFLALAWRGFVAGLVASIIVGMLPELLRFDGGIYIWPLVIAPPVSFLYVIWFHFRFNRR